MVDKNGRVVLMDFGLARTFSGDGMTPDGHDARDDGI